MTDQVETVAELKRIIEDSLGAERISSVRVTPYLDHADEPAYSISVSMTSEKDIPDARRQSQLTRRLRETLTDLGNPRFPYLYFDALDIDRSFDDEDEFEPLPED
ncbi:hypothetical protein DFR50_10699 [Roseiarcus fermentans]|uniref:Ribosome-binding factor A n=1 Tax=Roseiarcus fermentans TaxID=1473586 RepID=A0A366FNJ0_9HYPH|nr:hypothetical protein [Roseiarcus fermentans]RBP16137.1 hypothetical protein DFR50_10699 [Roseiarcus fermentans]